MRAEAGVEPSLAVALLAAPLIAAGGWLPLELPILVLLLALAPDGLRRPLRAGESFPMTVTFEKAGQVTVEFKVEPAGSMGGHGGAGPDPGHVGHKVKP